MQVAPDQRVDALHHLNFGELIPLTQLERLILLVFVVVIAFAGVPYVVSAGSGDRVTAAFQIFLTLLFALFAWSTRAALTLLVAAMAASFTFGSSSEALLALAIACGCVIRTGTSPMVSAYIGAFLLSNAAVIWLAPGDSRGSNMAAALLIATVSGTIGLILKAAAGREKRLAENLAAHRRAKDEIVRHERERIADELHDVIAHDLTIIAMHARVLDHESDDALRGVSQRAIGDAARKALSDIRRVVEQDEPDDAQSGVPAERFGMALADARTELEAARYSVSITGDAGHESITRLVGSALARIVREAVTNILKHSGGPGDVSIVVGVHRGSVELCVRSAALRPKQRLDVPSGGYGTIRMAERARTLGGRFSSGPDGDSWVVEVELPLS